MLLWPERMKIRLFGGGLSVGFVWIGFGSVVAAMILMIGWLYSTAVVGGWWFFIFRHDEGFVETCVLGKHVDEHFTSLNFR